jgi:hypothetical protein
MDIDESGIQFGRLCKMLRCTSPPPSTIYSTNLEVRTGIVRKNTREEKEKGTCQRKE